MFTKEDLKQLKEKGISEEMALGQIKNFKKGFPFINLSAPATEGKGIIKMDNRQLEYYAHFYEKISPNLSVVKFVPASGAATRMFKDLYSWLEKLESGIDVKTLMAQDRDAESFFSQLDTFAFWENLVEVMKEKGLDAHDCLEKGDCVPILTNLLDDVGLGYALLPKGLLKFHRYVGFTRTAAEEHLAEGANYARDAQRKVRLHFTVSSEHRGRFINHMGEVLTKYEQEYDVSFEVKFSVQKPSTDTLAVDLENKPFRNDDGSLLFRPGGHGALIQNLNELGQDVVFIKNIDNVVPDSLKEQTFLYKKALGGLLVSIQSKIFDILQSIDNDSLTLEEYEKTKSFLIDELNIDPVLLPEDLTDGKKVLKDILDKPIRICGMVQNVGEPGGGPFWVKNPDNKGQSLQIVESSQVNHKDQGQKTIFEQSTHFNPVDLVCGLKNYQGELFDLTQYVDPSTGFISQKSKDGKDLKAQELPGLWNGSMAGWITLFVDVPLVTFNPVKTIMDLLRKEHVQTR